MFIKLSLLSEEVSSPRTECDVRHQCEMDCSGGIIMNSYAKCAVCNSAQRIRKALEFDLSIPGPLWLKLQADEKGVLKANVLD